MRFVDRAVDERGTIVCGNDLDSSRQVSRHLRQPLPDRVDGRPRVPAIAQYHDAAHYFAVAVELRNSAPQLWTNANFGEIADRNRDCILARAYRNSLKILRALDVPCGPHHVFGFRELDHRTAAFAIALLDGRPELREGDSRRA